jgi:hypothetical protein
MHKYSTHRNRDRENQDRDHTAIKVTRELESSFVATEEISETHITMKTIPLSPLIKFSALKLAKRNCFGRCFKSKFKNRTCYRNEHEKSRRTKTDHARGLRPAVKKKTPDGPRRRKIPCHGQRRCRKIKIFWRLILESHQRKNGTGDQQFS